MASILKEAPIRKRFLGFTLKTLIKLYLDGYGWVAVIVDKNLNIKDWWEARSEFEAREKAARMHEKFRFQKPEGIPYTVFLIETSRY